MSPSFSERLAAARKGPPPYDPAADATRHHDEAAAFIHSLAGTVTADDASDQLRGTLAVAQALLAIDSRLDEIDSRLAEIAEGR